MSNKHVFNQYAKSQRIADRADIQRIFSTKKSVGARGISVFYLKKSVSDVARIAIIVSKKSAKLAVQRNRIRRIVRESFRHSQHRLVGCDIIVLIRQAAEALTNQQLRQLTDEQWKKISPKY